MYLLTEDLARAHRHERLGEARRQRQGRQVLLARRPGRTARRAAKRTRPTVARVI